MQGNMSLQVGDHGAFKTNNFLIMHFDFYFKNGSVYCFSIYIVQLFKMETLPVA